MKNRLPKDFALDPDFRPAPPPNLRRPPPGAAVEPGETRGGLFRAAQRSVGFHPAAMLAVAFVTGMLIGNWVKR